MNKWIGFVVIALSVTACGGDSSSKEEPLDDSPVSCNDLQIDFQNLGAEGIAETDAEATFAELNVWTSVTGNTASTPYDQGGYPASEPGQGDRLFTGGNEALSVAQQRIALTPNLVGCALTFSAEIGGFSSQEDNAVVELSFLDSTGAVLSMSSLGPATADDRQNATILLDMSTTTSVPALAVESQLQITQTRLSGLANDGYVDNISVTLE